MLGQILLEQNGLLMRGLYILEMAFSTKLMLIISDLSHGFEAVLARNGLGERTGSLHHSVLEWVLIRKTGSAWVEIA